MAALNRRLVLHVVDEASGTFREYFRVVVRLAIGFVSGFGHVKPQ